MTFVEIFLNKQYLGTTNIEVRYEYVRFLVEERGLITF